MTEPTQLIPPHWRRVPWWMLIGFAAIGIYAGIALATCERAPGDAPPTVQPTPLHTAGELAAIPPGQIPAFGGKLPCGEKALEEEINGNLRVLRCIDGHTWDEDSGAYLGQRGHAAWDPPPAPGAGYEIYHCPGCNGTGVAMSTSGPFTCPTCGGSGKMVTRFGSLVPPPKP